MNQTLTVEELAQRIDSGTPLQLIDVRSPDEYAIGHVPRAMNIPLEQLESRIGDLGQGPIAMLCQSGTRAGMACELLRSNHDNLLVVEGGTDAWARSGRKIVAGSAKRWALERQVRLAAGILVLIGTLLSLFLAPGWIFVAMFVGAGLTFSGLTNVCGMAFLLALLPWNRSKSCASPAAKLSA